MASMRSRASAAVSDVSIWIPFRRSLSARGSASSGAATTVRADGDLPAVLLDDAVRDREAQAGSGPDLLRGEERVEDPLLELARDPGAAIGEGDPDPLAVEAGCDPDRLPS